MTRPRQPIARIWSQLGPRLLPFADAASVQLPLPRLLRLALFQVSVGMALVLLNGTLNRVMIVELMVPAWLVSVMIALPVVFAPLRTLIGFRSDQHKSFLGWRRVPYIWIGSLLQFGGLAIMPFALLILSGDTHGPAWVGPLSAALAFLLTGSGLHVTQTAGLALATDLAPDAARPRVVALLYVMLLLGMVVSAMLFSALLADFSQLRLIQVIQGAALVTLFLNLVSLWKQEPRRPDLTRHDRPSVGFGAAWRSFNADGVSRRLLIAVGLGSMAFSMQDVLLEPYGAEVLGLDVGQTTLLTAFLAGGTLGAFGLAAVTLQRGANEYRLSSVGVLIGILAFVCLIFAGPAESAALFATGAALLGFGTGLFAVGTLIAAMALASANQRGFALGAWGAVQATAIGVGIALGGGLRDLVDVLAERGDFGSVLAQPATGYSFVYHTEIALLFATLVALGPLVRVPLQRMTGDGFGLAQLPG